MFDVGRVVTNSTTRLFLPENTVAEYLALYNDSYDEFEWKKYDAPPPRERNMWQVPEPGTPEERRYQASLERLRELGKEEFRVKWHTTKCELPVI